MKLLKVVVFSTVTVMSAEGAIGPNLIRGLVNPFEAFKPADAPWALNPLEQAIVLGAFERNGSQGPDLLDHVFLSDSEKKIVTFVVGTLVLGYPIINGIKWVVEHFRYK